MGFYLFVDLLFSYTESVWIIPKPVLQEKPIFPGNHFHCVLYFCFLLVWWDVLWEALHCFGCFLKLFSIKTSRVQRKCLQNSTLIEESSPGKGYLAANGFHLFCRKNFSQRKGKLGNWICKVNWGIIFWWNKQLESPEIWVPHICSGLCPLVPFPMLSIILAYGMIFDEFNSRCFHLFKQKYLCFLDSKEIMAVNLGYRVMPYTEEKLFSILEMKEWK